METRELMCFVQQAIDGDPEAFALICQIKGRSILYLCLQFCKDTTQAQEAAKQVFLHMEREIGISLTRAEDFKVWMSGIVFHTCKAQGDACPIPEALPARLTQPAAFA